MTTAKPFRPLVQGAPLTVGLTELVENRGDSAKLAHPHSNALSRHQPATHLSEAGSKSLAGTFTLPITEIDCYDGDPRLFPNEAYDALRQGILEGGYWDILSVTRRPNSQRFMMAAGGNTTLRVLKDLFATNQDPRFAEVECREQPYLGETTVLGRHLVENLNRGQMRFWEAAVGVDRLLQMLEGEKRASDPNAPDISVREACQVLASAGIQADKSTVAIWRFAARRLRPLGPALQALTARAVRSVLQPRINGVELLAKRFDVSPVDFDIAVLSPTLTEFGGRFVGDVGAQSESLDWEILCQKLELALARHLAEEPESIRGMIDVLRLNPQATLQQLRMPSPSLIARQPGEPQTDDTSDCPPGGQGVEPGLPLTTAGKQPSKSTARAREARAPQEPSTGPSLEPTGHGSQASAGTQRLRAAVQEFVDEIGMPIEIQELESMPLGFVFTPMALDGGTDSIPRPSQLPSKIQHIVWCALTALAGQACDARAADVLFVPSESEPSLKDYLLARLDPGSRPAIHRLDGIVDAVFEFVRQRPQSGQTFPGTE